MRTTSEAGLIILVRRRSKRIVMRTYRSWLKPMNVKARPPSLEWESALMTWFRWLTTPDDQLPPHIVAAGAEHPFTMTVRGEEWIMPGMHLPMIAASTMGRGDIPKPGGKVTVPDQFYTPVTDAAALPAGYGDPSWREAPYPAPFGPLAAEGLSAAAAALKNLGPPLTLPARGAITRSREGWLFALKADGEGGLLVVLDRAAATAELRVYSSDRLSAHVPVVPTGLWWGKLMQTWWQAQIDPGFDLPDGARFVDRP